MILTFVQTAAEVMEIKKEKKKKIPLHFLCDNNYKKNTPHIQYTLYIHSI